MAKKIFKLVLLFVFTLFSFERTIAQTKPNSTNTGTTGNLTTYSGSADITIAGAIIENYIINGSLNIKANNVTVRNCLINTTGTYGIRSNYGYTGLLIEDCEITGMTSAAILASDFIARRCNIWHSGADGIKPTNNFLIEACYFHHLGYITTAHADGIQMVAGSNGQILNNNFDMPYNEPGYKNSQCMIISTNNAIIDNITIDGNWVNGGGYSIQIRDKGNGYGNPTNVSITNNLFGTDYQFGVSVLDGNVVWECNKWEDTGNYIGSCSTLGNNNNQLNATFISYPNPVQDNFNIIDSNEADYELYNGLGELISKNKITSSTYKIDMSTLPRGIYFIKINNDNKSSFKKIIKQ